MMIVSMWCAFLQPISAYYNAAFSWLKIHPGGSRRVPTFQLSYSVLKVP
jgi:hypothetical protein